MLIPTRQLDTLRFREGTQACPAAQGWGKALELWPGGKVACRGGATARRCRIAAPACRKGLLNLWSSHPGGSRGGGLLTPPLKRDSGTRWPLGSVTTLSSMVRVKRWTHGVDSMFAALKRVIDLTPGSLRGGAADGFPVETSSFPERRDPWPEGRREPA